jgi:hypothetical protein
MELEKERWRSVTATPNAGELRHHLGLSSKNTLCIALRKVRAGSPSLMVVQLLTSFLPSMIVSHSFALVR